MVVTTERRVVVDCNGTHVTGVVTGIKEDTGRLIIRLDHNNQRIEAEPGSVSDR